MKLRTNLLIITLSICGLSNAQTTEPTNNVTNENSFLGTSNNFDVMFKRQGIFAGKLTNNSVSFGLGSLANTNSTSIGFEAGKYAGGVNNIYVGTGAGKGSITEPNDGNYNTVIGQGALANNSSGHSNICLGFDAGRSNYNGSGNIFIGNNSGGEDNTQVNNSIFIGTLSGFTNLESNKLAIDMGETNAPIIWGDFANDLLKFHAKVGIGGGGSNDTNFGVLPTYSGGVDVTNYSLFVKGGILTEEVRVSLQNTWADYVFKKDYKLPTLKEVENHIAQKGHLINVPSAEEVKNNGIELGEMTKIQQEKIEELTLYIIEQNKINDKQAKELEKQAEKLGKQNQEIQELKKLVTQILNKK